jgi:tryptophan-rich sensory protein
LADVEKLRRKNPNREKIIVSLLIFIAMAAAAALVGTQFGPDLVRRITEASWTPPNWLFARSDGALVLPSLLPVGRVALQSRKRYQADPDLAGATDSERTVVMAILRLRRPDLALVDIFALLITIGWFIASSKNISRIAAWLFVPSALWVGFATALNFAIWQLN